MQGHTQEHFQIQIDKLVKEIQHVKLRYKEDRVTTDSSKPGMKEFTQVMHYIDYTQQ